MFKTLAILPEYDFLAGGIRSFLVIVSHKNAQKYALLVIYAPKCSKICLFWQIC
jgi:hypothetical protein